ncbi:MAG: c-type cytochrome [Anaerolineales bacterium]|nr:c-type cytochrome [Anaerolineales bacterium]
MKNEEKQEYLEEYKKAKEKGIPFFPDAIFKDAIVALGVFLILAALVIFIGAPLEERADPSDTTYTPKPEWYFLFLFQLLKYFPGELEVIGVFVIPTIAVLLLFALPLIDRSAKRNFRARPVIIGVTAFAVVGVIFLTAQSILEAPPPAASTFGDTTAALYTDNCAPCHGSKIAVPAGTNLHEVIAQGKHEDMPAWGSDLSTDQIDALAGFILSPDGNSLFSDLCSACHEGPELIAGNPLEITESIDSGTDYPDHADLEIPEWSEVLNAEERAALLNFLVAPDGQRLFTVNCAQCHGRAVAFSGEEDELSTIITQGGLHLEMPPWREMLSDSDLDTLARYVVDPSGSPSGEALFDELCSTCHGERIPTSTDFETAREFIATGGAHETMPVWGDVLTSEQLDALTSYTLSASTGAPLQVGQELYAEYCATCHGDFGEGGPNPARPNDIIAPISSSEYLRTRDDSTLTSIVAQGQPNFGMSPFGTTYGGPLDDSEIESIVAFIRSWEINPPVELPPEIAERPLAPSGNEIYSEVCARCHGTGGEGGIGPTLLSQAFQDRYNDQELFDIIGIGHEATVMVPWGEILTSDQIQQIVEFIRELEVDEEVTTPSAISFQKDVVPILEEECIVCHGTFGGWDASSYDLVINSGDHGPSVIPGDVPASLLAQKLLGTHSEGAIMPPAGKLPDSKIQIILDWILAGALDN